MFGSFRWLAMLIGALIAGLISWAIHPENENKVIACGGKSSEQVELSNDSTEISALRDSLSMLMTSHRSVRLVRVIVRDTIDGTETIYLDSGATITDTIQVVRTVRDTVFVAVHDTLSAKKYGDDKLNDNEFSGTVYYDETGKPGVSAEYSRRAIGPISGLVYMDYQNSIESGLGMKADWKIFNARAVVRNYGYRGLDLGYEIKVGIGVAF
jgi:hypothetical protein